MGTNPLKGLQIEQQNLQMEEQLERPWGLDAKGCWRSGQYLLIPVVILHVVPPRRSAEPRDCAEEPLLVLL